MDDFQPLGPALKQLPATCPRGQTITGWVRLTDQQVFLGFRAQNKRSRLKRWSACGRSLSAKPHLLTLCLWTLFSVWLLILCYDCSGLLVNRARKEFYPELID